MELNRRDIVKNGLLAGSGLIIGGTAVASAASASANGENTLWTAWEKGGSRYVWGAQGPNVFDCAGLVRWSYHKVTGVWLPVGTYNQFKCSHIGIRGNYSLSSVSRHVTLGDPIFFYSPRLGVGHVGLFAGGNSLVSASSSQGAVGVRPITSFGNIYTSAYSGYWH